jgi:hypothetical protein
MKKLLLLLTGIICTGALHAAVINTVQGGVTGGNTTGSGTFPHFIINPDNNSGNSPLPYMRLVSYAYSKHDGSSFIMNDSTTYIYNSSDRGGSIVAEDLTSDERVLFDESYSYIRDATGVRGVMKRMQSYDGDNQVLNLTYMPWRAKGWADSARYLYGYYDHKMTISSLEVKVANQWDPHVKSDIVYNASGKVVKMDATNYKMYFAYDANNNLTEMRDEIWLITGSWQNKSRSTYTYNTTGMETEMLEKWDGSNWVYESKWDYTYFASKVETMTEYKRKSNAWVALEKHIYAYGNSLQRTNEVLQLWDAAQNKFVNSKYTEFVYESDVLLVDVNTSHWDGGNWQVGENDEHYHYYYEPYFPTAVKNIVAENGVRLYPVPAANTLNLNIGWNNAEPFNVAICDMRGMIVRHWAEQPAQNYSKQIDVSDLPNGNYIIKANSSSSQLTERFIVAK